MAVRLGRLDILTILLKHPYIDIGVRNYRNETALLLGVWRENITIIRRLLQVPNASYYLTLPAEVVKFCKSRGLGNLLEEKMK